MRLELSDLSLPAPSADDHDGGAGRGASWAQWLAQAGAEVALPLSKAIDRVHAIAAAPQLDRAAVEALQRELEQARRAAMTVQQLARMAAGEVRQFPEPVTLDALLRDVIAERQADAQARGMPLLETLRPVTVIADPSLLHSLLHTLLDWALDHGASAVHVSVDRDAKPRRARLYLRFRLRDDIASGSYTAASRLRDGQTLQWQLARHLSGAMGLALDRSDGAQACRLSVEFPRAMQAANADDAGFAATANSKPLAGHHVLIVSARRALRAEARDAIRHMGLMIDIVASVDEARAFCREGLPHAIVADAMLGGDRLLSLQRQLAAEAPGLPVIEVADDAEGYRPAVDDGTQLARVGRDSLVDGLPAALMFELTRDG